MKECLANLAFYWLSSITLFYKFDKTYDIHEHCKIFLYNTLGQKIVQNMSVISTHIFDPGILGS